MKYRNWIGAACLVSFLLTLVAGYEFSAAVERMDSMRLITTSARSVLISLLDSETGQRGYIITGDDHYLDSYHAGISAVPSKVNDLKQLVSNTGHPERLGDIERLVLAKVTELEKTVALRQKSFQDAATEVDRHIGKNLMDQIRRNLDELELWSDREFSKHEKNVLIFGRLTLAGLLATLILGTSLASRTWS